MPGDRARDGTTPVLAGMRALGQDVIMAAIDPFGAGGRLAGTSPTAGMSGP